MNSNYRPRPFLSLLVSLLCSVSAVAAAEEGDPPGFDAVAMRADLAALYTGLRSAHVALYAHRSEAEYDAFYAQLQSELNRKFTPFEAAVLFQRFAAYGNVAHARVEFPSEVYDAYRDAGGRSFPIYLRIVAGRSFVGHDLSGAARIQPGDEILSLNGRPMSDWLDQVSRHISADTPYIAHSLLEFTFPRYLWLELGDVDSFALTLRRDGKTFEMALDASTRESQQAAATAAPDRFSIDTNAREFRLLDGDIAYLKPGPFYNAENPASAWDNTSFVAFVDAAFEQILEADAHSLIIDLRQNPGGDNSFSDPMLSWIATAPFRFFEAFVVRSSDEAAASNAKRLEASGAGADSVSAMFARQYATVPRGETFDFDLPYAQPRDGQRFGGEVYVLVNRHSYSNAVNVAAIIQDAGLGTVVGEKTSDMATTYGSMETFELPNTKISVGFPKAHIIRPSGDRRTDGVTPDWVIASPIVDDASDAVLDALLLRLRED
ncbi:MAG: S41 family peptidase [Pseudomonadota bacterium]